MSSNACAAVLKDATLEIEMTLPTNYIAGDKVTVVVNLKKGTLAIV